MYVIISAEYTGDYAESMQLRVHVYALLEFEHVIPNKIIIWLSTHDDTLKHAQKIK